MRRTPNASLGREARPTSPSVWSARHSRALAQPPEKKTGINCCTDPRGRPRRLLRRSLGGYRPRVLEFQNVMQTGHFCGTGILPGGPWARCPNHSLRPCLARQISNYYDRRSHSISLLSSARSLRPVRLCAVGEPLTSFARTLSVRNCASWTIVHAASSFVVFLPRAICYLDHNGSQFNPNSDRHAGQT